MAKISVAIPKYLRDYARYNAISMSGTLAAVLKEDYERTRATPPSNRPGHADSNHTPGAGSR